MTNISAQMAVPIFCRLSGLDINKGQDYSCLCYNSFSEIQPRVKKQTLSDSDRDRLLFLVAVMAYEKYLFLEVSKECVESAKVLDVTLKENPTLKLTSAHNLSVSALSACSDLLSCPYSAFFAV